MRIALDAMGSDGAPAVEVEGAILAARAEGTDREIVLVGDRTLIEREMEKHRRVPPTLSIVHTSQVITMEDHPVDALRKKKDTSLARTLDLVKRGEAAAAVSAGNTGAVLVGARITLGVLPGLDRPAIASVIPVIPSLRGVSVLIDSGANSDCKPLHLLQFAIMGSEYYRFITGKPRPAIGLLSIGAESTKGNELTRETYKILEKSGLNFIGNVEGRDVFLGKADVIVSDGFVGNIVLKVGEGLVSALHNVLLREIKRHVLRMIGGVLMKPAFMRMRKRGDYTEYGGAPLLGVKGTCIICHGSS
ncbi:MAG: phosphate acyltransferase PlsX [Candidatus Aureabacteria bacterium]|nr:phosphate acyltransferase PlsX [Candidatus Auribacterota bacterium]